MTDEEREAERLAWIAEGEEALARMRRKYAHLADPRHQREARARIAAPADYWLARSRRLDHLRSSAELLKDAENGLD
jgi:hypothetical protein